jgi:hypothetical protein
MVKATEQQSSTNRLAGGRAPVSSPGPAPAPTNTARPTGAKLRYIDRPEMAETFSDSVSRLVFDGQVLRIEFATTRLDEVKPNTPITGRRYPACRIVLSPSGAIDLINRIQQIAAALRKAAPVRQAPQAVDAVR